MKVLFLCQRYYPSIGGVEKHVKKLSKELQKKGYEIEIITEQINPRSKKEIETEKINGIKVHYISFGKPSKLKKFRIWFQLWKLRSSFQSADIVHCHDVFIWYLPFRFLFPFKKVFITFHGYESYPIPKKNIIIHQMSDFLSNGNISIGAFIPKWYKTSATKISYGATEIPKYQNEFSRLQNALFWGRLDEQTGILEYVHASSLIQKKYPSFSLDIIGNGKYENEIHGELIRVFPFRDNPEEKLRQYRFAFVSRYLSILEAFVARRLVFAVYDNPIKKDYLFMTPFKDFMFIAKNEQELADQVVSVLNDPQKEQKMIDSAWKWVQDQTWEHMAENYISLWSGSK